MPGEFQNNEEIQDALRQFQESPYSALQAEKPKVLEPEIPAMVRLVMKLSGGAIKERRQAEYVLLAIISLLILLSLLILTQKRNDPNFNWQNPDPSKQQAP